VAEGAAPGDPRALNALLERRAELRTRELERSMRELESYSHVIAHHLRAPLRSVDACVTLIERHHRAGLDAEGAALFARLRASALRMSELLDGLIEHAKLGRRRLVRQAVAMTDVVKACLDDMRLSEPDRERISVAPLPAAPADATLMQLAWRELIGNALKFSERAADRSVRIEGAVRHGMAEFRISDGGVGFASRAACSSSISCAARLTPAPAGPAPRLTNSVRLGASTASPRPSTAERHPTRGDPSVGGAKGWTGG